MAGGEQGVSGPSLARVIFSAFHARSFAVAHWRLLGMGRQKEGRKTVTRSKKLVLGLLVVFAMEDVPIFFTVKEIGWGGKKEGCAVKRYVF